MRDYRDAKVMAQTIRATLAAKGVKVTISESLELIAKAFGAADWNTLSAAIKAAEPPKERAGEAPPVDKQALGKPTRRSASTAAAARRAEYTTLEHPLLALIEDAHAAAVMEACQVDLGALRAALARYEAAWIRLEAVHAENEPAMGAIVGRVRGGFTVDLGGASAFLPGSQVDVRPVRDFGPLMGREQPFAILKMDRPRRNIVVSRRALLEEAAASSGS